MCIDQLKSDLLMHYFIGDIYDQKVIKELSRTYGVSVKYIMKKCNEFNITNERLEGGFHSGKGNE